MTNTIIMSEVNAVKKDVKPKEIFISNSTVKRLLTDVKKIYNNPLTHHNIHYKHDDKDILKGYAVIMGPEDTPYFGGVYLFEFNFPDNYPFSPPIIKYKTNDGVTRFNPNLYKNGKVCISILNTWQGEEWSSCQNISSILLTLVTLLNNKPLLNEPGITERHPDFNKYTRSILYKNIDFAVISFLDIENWPHEFKQFHPIYLEYFQKIKDKIYDVIKNNISTSETIYIGAYHMNTIINYEALDMKFKGAIEKL
tara:strand:- start:3947 stop:4705 length:759 start_codon:yes stop_codon:yes gene_type:complete